MFTVELLVYKPQERRLIRSPASNFFGEFFHAPFVRFCGEIPTFQVKTHFFLLSEPFRSYSFNTYLELTLNPTVHIATWHTYAALLDAESYICVHTADFWCSGRIFYRSPSTRGLLTAHFREHFYIILISHLRFQSALREWSEVPKFVSIGELCLNVVWQDNTNAPYYFYEMSFNLQKCFHFYFLILFD